VVANTVWGEWEGRHDSAADRARSSIRESTTKNYPRDNSVADAPFADDEPRADEAKEPPDNSVVDEQ
jgi:hypothetical protein